MIFAAATLYAFGKAFLWPTMLAVAGERYPQSGAVAMSTLGASGMLCVGFIGAELIGVQQSIATTTHLRENNKAIYDEYKETKVSSFPSWGENLGFSMFEFEQLSAAKQQKTMEDKSAPNNQTITTAFDHGSRSALTKTAMIPCAMAIGYLVLLLYFKSIGGYKVLRLNDDDVAAAADDGGAASDS